MLGARAQNAAAQLGAKGSQQSRDDAVVLRLLPARIVQRRVPEDVLGVQIDTFHPKQKVDCVDVAHGGRHVQGRAAKGVCGVHVAAVLDEPAHFLRVVGVRRGAQLESPIRGAQHRAVAHELFADGGLTRQQCVLEGRAPRLPAALRMRVHVRAERHEKLHVLQLSCGRGKVQRRAPVRDAGVHVGSVEAEAPQRLRVRAPRRGAEVVRLFLLSRAAGAAQAGDGLGGSGMAAHECLDERRVPACILHVQLGSSGDQRADHLYVARRRGKVQSSPAKQVAVVHVHRVCGKVFSYPCHVTLCALGAELEVVQLEPVHFRGAHDRFHRLLPCL
mmetsp:Transcript_408/g.1154  ORF Transcript_408/g.1154 Transcript_408/m.1154 type:complete len:331 (+) Transcript_408:917-1909(+)